MNLNTAQRLALNLDSHIVIDAGAGTGKTSTIVDRVIEHYLTEDQRATRILPAPERPSRLEGGLLLSPVSETIDLQKWGGLLPGEVVLLTFTNRASDEMRDRLRNRISRLKPGPIGDDGINRTDPRIRHQGFNEQLLTLLEDAPIGTIDSFFNQLISPYKGYLGDSFSKDVISDSSRILLIESALNTLWRLPNSFNLIGDAVDAGISSEIASQVLNARDNIARHYSGRRTAANILRSLVYKSIFITEGSRRLLNQDGNVEPNLLCERIIESIDMSDVTIHSDKIYLQITKYCDFVKEHVNVLAPAGVFSDTRIAVLDALSISGPPNDKWGKLVWLSHVLLCITSESSIMSDKPSIFPHSKLPSNSWERGIKNYGEISDKTTKETVRDGMKEITNEVKDIWLTNIGKLLLHYTQIALILDNSKPPSTSDDWHHPLQSLPFPLPERLKSEEKVSKFHFTLDAEVRNLNDLRLILDGFMGILNKLKENEETHDYEDVQRLTGDLLLANCPDTCRYFYPKAIQDALDSLGIETWRDDNILSAFEVLDNMEKNPNLAGNSSHNLSAIRMDLTQRYDLLKRIRRRYRAFIIDEAQDNSPLQWRLLSRLWGERHTEQDEISIPNTPWQPTVCYVGDVKQSIYAFRQAEVTGFLQYAKILRTINNQEFSSIKALTRAPPLRRENASRDPRNSYNLSIAKANLIAKEGGRRLIPWIPFDLSDTHLPIPSPEEVEARKEGLIRLQVNYRTDGGLLRVMNQWWNDIFHSKHRTIPNGNFYATPQPLYPSREKINIHGSLEWICPIGTGGNVNPTTNLKIPLDPFGPGKPDSIERQSMMIAMRVKNLIEGNPVKVQSSDGKWFELPAEKPVEPSEIMILLPSRTRIRDVILRYLHDYGVPAQADKEGGLLDRPAAHTIEGLLQFIARPFSRHHASWVARSTLIGFDDSRLQEFISNSSKDENLLLRLKNFTVNERQKRLVQRWIELSSSGRIIDLLEETIDRSDILVAYPDIVSRQDIEQTIDIIRSLSREVGGDPIILADRIRNLRESSGNTLEAVTIPPSDAVRVMTIHGSKGLQSKVVILADIFSGRQTNMTMDDRSRLIVGPELFAGNPKPWSNQPSPTSALWNHARKIHMARKNAESRRLLYVGATRAENKLIIVGSTKETSWVHDQGINSPWTYNESLPQLGEMWIESLRQGSGNRGENNSPWIDSSDITSDNMPIRNKGNRIFDPSTMNDHGYLGDLEGLQGISIFHHPECFNLTKNQEYAISTPLVRIEKIHKNAIKSTKQEIPKFTTPRIDSFMRLKIAPSKISILEKCPRRYWFETKGGVSSMPVIPTENTSNSEGLPRGIDAALFGTIVHRIIEIGIGNPGPAGKEPTTPLPKSWIQKTPDLIDNSNIHKIVFDELLPPNTDKKKISLLVDLMIERLKFGPLGILSSGESFNGHRVEGLRTEMPFNITKKLKLNDFIRTQWTPDGLEPLSKIESVEFEMDGLIDLVLCTTCEGESFIRPVDLKTEEARKLINGQKTGLLESLGIEGTQPSCDAEIEVLLHHRMQQALYFRALQSIEEKRYESGYKPRKVLPPAILIGVTGRFVIYPKEILDDALKDLNQNLILASEMALGSNVSLSDYPCKCDECP
tara:strand:+ start:6005 stop:10879 length:4875 start_codon:yes stop_codon:yes gene_type:complete